MRFKLIIVLVLSCFIFSPLKIYAQEAISSENLSEFYVEYFNKDKLNQNNAQDEYLEQIEIDDYEALLEKVRVDNIFDEISSLFSRGIKGSLKNTLSFVSLLLICAVLRSFKPENKQLDFVILLFALTFSVLPATEVIAAFVDAIKAASVFLTSFFPMYLSILAAKGKLMTASVVSTVLMGSCSLLSNVTSFLIVPLLGMQMSLNIGCSFLNDFRLYDFTRALNKGALWILSAVCTVFLAVLSLQTIVSVPADKLTTKTLKFVATSAVPLVGGVISESIGTVGSYLKLLSSSAAIYAVIAVAVVLLPVIIDILVWKLSLFLCRMATEVLNIKSCSDVLRSAESCFTVILGVTILIFLFFIISITIFTVI